MSSSHASKESASDLNHCGKRDVIVCHIDRGMILCQKHVKILQNEKKSLMMAQTQRNLFTSDVERHLKNLHIVAKANDIVNLVLSNLWKR